jgi:uncharacterized protein (TIGR03663 family)
MSGWRAAAALAGLVVLAAAMRLPSLPLRPMHADEAIHADRAGSLLEGRGYAYDPAEYHGPTLVYMTLVPAALRGQRTYAALDEATLRVVPAALGVALVAAHLGAAPFVGTAAALAGALLAALSPAMVYYSRYYIHEVPLVLFGLGALLAAARYLERPGPRPAALAGACAGLMLATKETAVLSLAAIAVAFVAVGGLRRTEGATGRLVRHLAIALLAAILVTAPLFSSFFTRPQGLLDALRAYGLYLHRGSTWSWHVHPWHYYLGLLARFPASGTPFWSEAAILLLAAAGAAAGFRDRLGRDARAVRFVAVYTAVLLAAYSAIPYKTPWCVLGFLDGLILLAGVGAVVLVRAARAKALKASAAVLLAAAASHLGWQAWAASFRYPADPRNPWVYAHTATDVFTIVSAAEALAAAHPDGRALPVQVIASANVWPLPWYLRRFPRVAWWTGVSDAAGNAPVILATPDMEAALVRRMYELPPPGERELYVPIFDRRVELRPQVELRGYATNSLWERHRQREAR